MKGRLVLLVDGETTHKIEFTAEAEIGRSPSSTVVVASRAVSGRHARIEFDAGYERFLLEDLQSMNGTQLDGMRVRGREPLGHLNVITLAGKHELIFQDLSLCMARGGEMTVSPSIAAEDSVGVSIESLARPVRPRVEPRLRLAVAKTKQDFQLEEGDNVVGRQPGSDLRIDLPDISRRHALIRVVEGRVTVRDLGSSNKTYVDGKETGSAAVEAEPGMLIEFGRIKTQLLLD